MKYNYREATINTCQTQICIKIIKNFLFCLSIVLKFYIITVHTLTSNMFLFVLFCFSGWWLKCGSSRGSGECGRKWTLL